MTRERVPSTDQSRLFEACTAAASFYLDELRGSRGRGPRDYLVRRGLGSLLTSPTWVIGYAPPGWTRLTDHLRGRGLTPPEILQSGLAVMTHQKTIVDRFRDRIMIGMRNEAGDLVGYIGRAAPQPSGEPKYLNTPRTEIYDKGSILFGLGDAGGLLTVGAIPVLVEGPFDALAVIATESSGSTPLIGLSPCGTALTEAQVTLLARHTSGPVIVAFDGDHAGEIATAAAHRRLARTFAVTRSVRLQPGTDPASILEKDGPGVLRSALSRTTALVDRVVDDVLHRYGRHIDNAEAKVCALREVAPLVAASPQEDVARQAARLAGLLRLDAVTIARELASAATQLGGRIPSTTGRVSELSTEPSMVPRTAYAWGVHMTSQARRDRP